MIVFYDFLTDRIETGGFSTEDTLASVLPLMREVIEAHAAGKVAPLEGLEELHVEDGRIWFEEAKRCDLRNKSAELRRVEAANRARVDIVAETRRTTDVDDGTEKVINLTIGDREKPITRAVYLPGYVTWEHQLGHHDPLTDIFSLGMILASLACGLDLNDEEDLERFVTARQNLFLLSPDLHPVVARAVVRMTEVDRHRRAQDLPALLHNLENYRDQEVDFDDDLARIEGFRDKDPRTKQHVVLTKLKERLFEISRRNRLLHFRPTMQTVNLTHASVPLSFDIENIRADQILVWNDSLQKTLASGTSVSLNKYLNFSEALYLPSVLDRIMADARRDQAEFGFAQLRLVACFLHWANLKEKPIEQYESPLVLVPVRLKKKKGIRDTHTLEPLSNEAEINPVIRHQFKQLYDIDLPELIDLSQTSLDKFHEYLLAKIQASDASITLQKIDRPRIALIHDKARRKLDQYRRRARIAGRGVRKYLDLDYSYDPANYHPLGITLFSTKVRPPSSHLREIIEENPRPRSFVAPEPEAPTAEKERTFYSLQEGGGDNPYTWSFDLCSVTLANFKYRRMSLVRDYDALLEDQPPNPAFDATFSLVPRPVEPDLAEPPALEDRYDVVPCDPTQATAIAEAHAGKSYIVQGPPGTGKSQTITNLIADYVAHGKRVLFVCEKRAAIDVVFARLRQCGLADLCCLIHDSQTDKKEFVMNLKQTYETFLGEVDDAESDNVKRKDLLRRLTGDLEPLEQFDAAIQRTHDHVDLSVRELLDRCVELLNERPQLSPAERERMPDYAHWHRHRERIDQYCSSVKEFQKDGILAHHPLHTLSPRLASVDRPLELISTSVERAARHHDGVEQTLGRSGVPQDQWEQVARARQLIEYAKKVRPIARLGQMALLNPKSEWAGQFAKSVKEYREQQKAVRSAEEANKAWRQKFPADELPNAIAQAQAFEGRVLSVIQPSWWRLRGVLRRAYDFKSHVVRPSWTQVLEGLEKEYQLTDELARQVAEIAETYRIDGNVEELVELVLTLRDEAPQLPEWLQRIHVALLKSKQSKEIVEKLVEADEHLSGLLTELSRILDDVDGLTLEEHQSRLVRVTETLDDLPDYLQCLSEIAEVPSELSATVRTLPLTPTQIEAAIADVSLDKVYRADRPLSRFDGAIRRRHARRLETLYRSWLDANAHEIRTRVRHRFQQHVHVAGLPAAQLEPEQKEFKKRYNKGRRELEHEFGKSMRYKSIRDLVADESGDVVRDLKPVWLMSPLSVSDTLPLDTNHFDVVIFDEASQITLEESVPSLFRATQAIVVGDEMQLPPTDFFSAKRTDEEEDLLVEEAGELVQYDLDSNSFLNHAAKNLSSTMLGWHYRSRSESLISFSNWTFYDGRLLTVPEEHLPPPNRAPLVAQEAAAAEAHADELLNRSVSFHFMEHGVYDKRRNRAEADYIAVLVRQMLQRQDGVSIGIVAFSEAQQDEIEGALDRLAQDDKEFRDLLDQELEREEDGQFVGLLVKNLENIQGDERDVIILSVCYGYDSNRKMRMNFGPINKSGGEKRLNVAFSRAKHHMALVSSINHADIKNDYNDGANSLKNYLRYAEAVSIGDLETAQRVLRGMSRWHDEERDGQDATSSPVADQIAAALGGHGYDVDHSVGQSHFRCDLAVRGDGDTRYRLGILIDGEAYYDQSDLLERDMMRPKLLRDFGWSIAHVLAKDWYADRETVVDRLLRQIEGEEEPEEEGLDDEEALMEDLASDNAPAGPESSPDLEMSLDLAGVTTEEDEDSSPADDPPSQPLDIASEDGNPDTPMDVEVLAPVAVSETGDSVAGRYFEFVDGKSSKFWEISRTGNEHTVRFGRIGTNGQSKTKEFADGEVAKRDAERLIREKLRKGYEEK
ncbi:MAG: WGR domain-containing protein [Planctomycetota bacterium]|nr:MAG: WGR domain-containing protein [Planctomycetota bacterium]REK18452.1 MAG: WGR domain-containing protein [Planctomycetota bacterium]REK39487.1 MAG: WGR domain-containing protein [Planctomycetota bacterium]